MSTTIHSSYSWLFFNFHLFWFLYVSFVFIIYIQITEHRFYFRQLYIHRPLQVYKYMNVDMFWHNNKTTSYWILASELCSLPQTDFDMGVQKVKINHAYRKGKQLFYNLLFFTCTSSNVNVHVLLYLSFMSLRCNYIFYTKI